MYITCANKVVVQLLCDVVACSHKQFLVMVVIGQLRVARFPRRFSREPVLSTLHFML